MAGGVSAPAVYVGADWAGGGWLAAAFEGESFAGAAFYREAGELWSAHGERAERICVDAPIGLPTAGREERACDELAREAVGPRSSSVFRVPVRAAVHKQSRRAASLVNERKTGTGIGVHTWNIAAPVRQLDSLLRNVAPTREAFRESHPEVCFRAFAGEPLAHAKTTAAGYAERMDALEAHDPDAPDVVRDVARAGGDEATVDDAVDAVALALTARPGENPLRSLPPDPPVDDEGLPMEIVYRSGVKLA